MTGFKAKMPAKLCPLSPNLIAQGFLMALFAFGSLFQACSQEAQTFDEKLQQLYSYSVPLLKPAELKQKLAKKDTVYLLDTRSPAEFKVSHLQHSELIGYEDFTKKQVQHIPKHATVVTYCTVGYRSEKIAEELQTLGFKDVYNLYGSMISWVNAGYPVYNQQGDQTRKVHTYSREWGQWLKKGKAVYDE